MLKRIKTPRFLALIILILSACSLTEPSAPEKICNNLLAEDLIISTECTSDKLYTTFMPHYFHVGETTFDYVSVGMNGFEQLDFFKGQVGCKENQQRIIVEYLTGTTESVKLWFCDEVLVAISYHS